MEIDLSRTSPLDPWNRSIDRNVRRVLSGGMLNLSMLSEFPGTSFSQTSWVVVTAWCVSLLVSPIIVQLCRNYSIRLIAVIGGLSMNLSFLFASFGHEVHQVFIRWELSDSKTRKC